jgi:hypothetical protein
MYEYDYDGLALYCQLADAGGLQDSTMFVDENTDALGVEARKDVASQWEYLRRGIRLAIYIDLPTRFCGRHAHPLWP